MNMLYRLSRIIKYFFIIFFVFCDINCENRRIVNNDSENDQSVNKFTDIFSGDWYDVNDGMHDFITFSFDEKQNFTWNYQTYTYKGFIQISEVDSVVSFVTTWRSFPARYPEEITRFRFYWLDDITLIFEPINAPWIHIPYYLTRKENIG